MESMEYISLNLMIASE